MDLFINKLRTVEIQDRRNTVFFVIWMLQIPVYEN